MACDKVVPLLFKAFPLVLKDTCMTRLGVIPRQGITWGLYRWTHTSRCACGRGALLPVLSILTRSLSYKTWHSESWPLWPREKMHRLCQNIRGNIESNWIPFPGVNSDLSSNICKIWIHVRTGTCYCFVVSFFRSVSAAIYTSVGLSVGVTVVKIIFDRRREKIPSRRSPEDLRSPRDYHDIVMSIMKDQSAQNFIYKYPVQESSSNHHQQLLVHTVYERK